MNAMRFLVVASWQHLGVTQSGVKNTLCRRGDIERANRDNCLDRFRGCVAVLGRGDIGVTSMDLVAWIPVVLEEPKKGE